jgi:hypothetical protein
MIKLVIRFIVKLIQIVQEQTVMLFLKLEEYVNFAFLSIKNMNLKSFILWISSIWICEYG